jgi:NTE family protein
LPVTPPDVLIQPHLGRVGLFDFHRADETIALGAEAVRARDRASSMQLPR